MNFLMYPCTFMLSLFLERFTQAVFIHHVLEDLPPPPIAIWQQQANRQNQPRFRPVNARFLHWLSIEKHRAQLIQTLIKESANEDVAFAVKIFI